MSAPSKKPKQVKRRTPPATPASTSAKRASPPTKRAQPGHGFDFVAFGKRLEAAVRDAVGEVVAKHPKEEFCGFALYSDDCAMTICPSFNSRAHLLKRIAEDPSEANYLTFAPAEWRFESVGADAQFSALSALLRNHVSNLSGKRAEMFQRDLAETAIATLEQLRNQSFFKKIARDPMVILFQASPSDPQPTAERRMIRRLNSDEVTQQHRGWVRTWGS